MTRADLPALHSLGFENDELKELSLWEPATGEPEDLADAYIRRSKKKDTLTTLRGHLRDVCRRAREEGKHIRHVWFEQKSASKVTVRREEFEQAVDAINQNLSKTLYVYRTDRLSRRGMGAVDRQIDEFDRRKARIVSVSEGLDSSQPGMRIVFGILADRAREEAKMITERTQDSSDEFKREGNWHGGVTPFGLWSPKGSKRLKRHLEEYPIARRIAEYLLDGKVPKWIAETLNAQGVRTRKGKMWRAQTIIHLAHSPAWAGLVPNRERVHDEDDNPLEKWVKRAEPLLNAKGEPIRCGVGVVTYEEWLRIQRTFASRTGNERGKGRNRGTGRGVRQHATIAGWILQCPRCKGPMSNGGTNYRCEARVSQGKAACEGTVTGRQRVDEAVGSMWVNHIFRLSPESPTIHEIARRWLSYQNPETETQKRKVTSLYDAAIERQARLRKEFFILGRMSEDQFEELRAQQDTLVAELKAEYDELAKGADLTPLMSPTSLATIWAAEGIEGRRALFKAACKSLTLTLPKGPGDRTPILERLVPEWRDTTGLPVDVREGAQKTLNRRRARKATATAS